MKKSILGLVLLVSQGAMASQGSVEARCLTRYSADSGYQVVVAKEAGKALVARLSRITIAGAFVVSDSRVVRVDDQNLDQRSYIGKDIEILVDLNKVVSDGSFEAKLTGSFLKQAQGADLVCELTDTQVQLPPVIGPLPGTFTCMAFWEGATFDPTTRSCVARGASGCSSPFEFSNVAECESAFRSRFFK